MEPSSNYLVLTIEKPIERSFFKAFRQTVGGQTPNEETIQALVFGGQSINAIEVGSEETRRVLRVVTELMDIAPLHLVFMILIWSWVKN